MDTLCDHCRIEWRLGEPMANPRRTTASSSRRHGRSTAAPRPTNRSATRNAGALNGDWLSLTDLGRVYGISAIHTGKLLHSAGLRQADGSPTPLALRDGLAQRQHSGQHQQALWHRGACAPHLEGQGGVAQKHHTLIALWAELLATLHQGVPSIAISAEEMADDIPGELVQPVNRELQARGCSFQVGR